MGKPKIRFKGYTEDWEQRKLGDLVKDGILEAPLDGNHGEKHPTSDEYVESGIPFLMASDIHNGTVNISSCKYITKERAKKLDKGFARNGDVLLTHKATIGETAILGNLTTEYAMLTPQVTYYRIKNEKRLNREYLYSFFNSLDFQTELKTKAAQSTRPYIGITAQQNLRIILPRKIDEQRKLGFYFRTLDNLITLHQRKCEETKKLKKYMLQKMFPQNGQLVPKIRFAGFTEDWEQRKLGKLAGKVIGGGTPKTNIAEYWNGDIPWIQSSNVQENEMFSFDIPKSITQEGLDKSAAKMVPENSIAVVTHVGVGKLVFVPFSYTTSQDFTSLAELKTDAKFTCYSLFQRLQNDLHVVQGSAIKGITKDDLLTKEIMVPVIEEQQKIGEYFSNLDNLITLHQRKCDELQNMKKYMLQNMFN